MSNATRQLIVSDQPDGWMNDAGDMNMLDRA
jgi:hypothetical protein